MTSALFSIVPWYSWAVVAIALVAITAAGAWPLVLALLRRVPAEIYAAAAVLALAVVVHLWLDSRDVAAAEAAKDRYYEGVLRGVRAFYQGELDAANSRAQAAADELRTTVERMNRERDLERAAAEKKRLEDLAKLKKGFDAYVSAKQNASCPDVPRGYLMRRAASASYANGAGQVSGPPASAADLDGPSGVSLSDLDAVDAEAAGAYRACRERVSAWEKWADDVDRYVGRLKSIIQPERKENR